MLTVWALVPSGWCPDRTEHPLDRRALGRRLSSALEHGRISISESRLLSYDLKEEEELGEGEGKRFTRKWHRLEPNERTC